MLRYYKRLLGTTVPCHWSFDIGDYYPEPSVDGTRLSTDFTRQEIRDAFFSMNTRSSPGPNGFGPCFYRTFWAMLERDVIVLFAAFAADTLNLDRLNQADLVLLLKKDGVRTPDAFCPISLQGCLVKAFTKAMVHRLQPHIESLVSSDQTGFIKGRCIAENYICVTELFSCCHSRKSRAAVLKLDFKKAFDSVAWSSLDTILRA